MTVLSTKTLYYIIRKSKKSEIEIVEPISYNSYNRTYTPVFDYINATPYSTQQEVEKRVVVLNMLAELEMNNQTKTVYSCVKQTETIEEIQSDL